MLLKILNRVDQLFWPAVMLNSAIWLVADILGYIPLSDVAFTVNHISLFIALAVIDIKQEINK